MKRTDLDSIVLGTPPDTGDDWYFAPRPGESLDDAEVTIVSVPLDVAKDRTGESERSVGESTGE